jgi:hypothetical protein
MLAEDHATQILSGSGEPAGAVRHGHNSRRHGHKHGNGIRRAGGN